MWHTKIYSYCGENGMVLPELVASFLLLKGIFQKALQEGVRTAPTCAWASMAQAGIARNKSVKIIIKKHAGYK